MTFTKEQVLQICIQAVDKYGQDSQFEMMVEECAELIKAVQKMKRATPGVDSLECLRELIDEIADVEIMLHQMRYLIGDEEIDKQKDKKLERLQIRLNKINHIH